MDNLINSSHVVDRPIQQGDAGIIFRLNGDVQVFTSGALEDGRLSSGQDVQITKIKALVCALSVPSIMDTLIMMSEDPAIVGEGGIDLGVKH